MSYSGSTAGTTLANPPRRIAGDLTATRTTATSLSTAPAAPGSQGGQLWTYISTNSTAEVTASNFFSDGYYLGMRPGDFVMGAQFTSAGSSVIPWLGVVASVSTDGASLHATLVGT